MMGPQELVVLSMLSCRLRRLQTEGKMDYFWYRFYGRHFHMTGADAERYIALPPKDIFARLAKLSIAGKWHVKGRVTQMAQEVENDYGYVQFFIEKERLSPMESSFEG